jgi:hypothetical protein
MQVEEQDLCISSFQYKVRIESQIIIINIQNLSHSIRGIAKSAIQFRYYLNILYYIITFFRERSLGSTAIDRSKFRKASYNIHLFNVSFSTTDLSLAMCIIQAAICESGDEYKMLINYDH